MDATRHLVERLHQNADLVAARHRNLLAVVAVGHRARGLREVADRRHHPARREDRGPHRHQHGQQRHQAEREREAELERSAQVHQLLVVGERRLHRLAELGVARRQRLQHLQHAYRAANLASVYRHHHAQLQAGFAGGVEVGVGQALAHLREDGVARAVGHERAGFGRGLDGGGENLAVLGEQRELGDAVLLAQTVERREQGARGARVGRDQLQFLAHRLGVLHQVLLGGLKRRASEQQRVIERALDLHVEPVVDTAVERLDREEEHHRYRQHRQQHEHDQQSQRQARAERARAVLLHQPVNIEQDHAEQQHNAEHVDQQQQRVHAPEQRRVLGRGVHHQQRRQQQAGQHRKRHDAGEVAFGGTGDQGANFHVLHPLLRRQASEV